MTKERQIPIKALFDFYSARLFSFPEWMMLLVLSSMFVPLTRYFDLKFNLFGFNCKNTDDRSRCTYCGAAVNSISIVCPYCKKELPADIVNALKTESDKEKMKPVTKTETQVIVEYVVGAIFTILSALIYVILNPGSSAVVMVGMLGASSVMLLFTMVYVKWGFGKSLPSIKFFPRDNGFLVFSEFFLISQLISLYKAMS